MNFERPGALLLLAVLPVLFILYRRFDHLRTSHWSGSQRRARHLPPIAYILAIGLLVSAFAQPSTDVTLPAQKGRLIMAFDTSGSMIADDVEENRLSFAQTGALNMLNELDDAVEVGIVSFSEGGTVLLEPTKDRAAAAAAIGRLQAQGSTSLFGGVFSALESAAESAVTNSLDGIDGGPPQPLDLGNLNRASIVVFSDGEDTTGADPRPLAELAAISSIQIDTVGVGTLGGTTIEIDGVSRTTALQEEVLQSVAETANGSYQQVERTAQLDEISTTVATEFVLETQRQEISALVSLAAILLVAIAALTSWAWFGRIP